VDEQLLSLVAEIRLEHVPPHYMKSILDDPWLQKVPPPSPFPSLLLPPAMIFWKIWECSTRCASAKMDAC